MSRPTSRRTSTTAPVGAEGPACSPKSFQQSACPANAPARRSSEGQDAEVEPRDRRQAEYTRFLRAGPRVLVNLGELVLADPDLATKPAPIAVSVCPQGVHPVTGWKGKGAPDRGCPGRPMSGRPGHRDQARSNRSRSMTLSHAATKSRMNFSFASSHA